MPWLEKAAVRYKLVDIADEDELKIHKAPISYLGGVGMLLGIGGGIALGIVLYPSLLWQLTAVYAAGIMVFLFGFWDDWKWKHITQRKPIQKLALVIAVQLAMAIVLLFAGVRPDLFISFIPPVLVSFGAIFIVSNSMNLQDGMDGLAGTLAAISAAGFFIISILLGFLLPATLSLILLGSIVAFLRFNLPPASIFMGDSGAYLLGSLLAVLILMLPLVVTLIGFIGTVFLIGIPIFESAYTIMRRLIGGKTFLMGDRGHAFDRMLQAGYSTRATLFFFSMLQVISVGIGIFLVL